MSAYLLLRDNKRTGPHTFGELMSIGLTSLDLIWVEGRSRCWNHPPELEDFKQCTLLESGRRHPRSTGTEPLPGISFRLPDHDPSHHPWGPIPTLALQGLDHFMAPLMRQRAVALSTDRGDGDLSIFSMPLLNGMAHRGDFAPGHGQPRGEGQSRPSNLSLRDRRNTPQGKTLRRSRKKYPHHLDLSSLLTDHRGPDSRTPPAEMAEGGFHIEFA